MESPDGEPFSALHSDSRKAGCSALSFGAQAQTTVKTHSPIQRRREATLSSTGEKKPQHGNWDHWDTQTLQPWWCNNSQRGKLPPCHLTVLHINFYKSNNFISSYMTHFVILPAQKKFVCLFIFVELLKKVLFEITCHLKKHCLLLFCTTS